MLGEFETDGTVVVSDLEAGIGTLSRVKPGDIDVALIVCEPSVKSIEVARRAAGIGAHRMLVVANRLSEHDDLERVRAALAGIEIVPVPEDPGIAAADRAGRAPLDASPESPGVGAIHRLAHRLLEGPTKEEVNDRVRS